MWPPRGSSDLHSKSPGCLLVQENHRESSIPFGRRLVFLFCKKAFHQESIKEFSRTTNSTREIELKNSIINVGVDLFNFYPIKLDDVVAELKRANLRGLQSAAKDFSGDS